MYFFFGYSLLFMLLVVAFFFISLSFDAVIIEEDLLLQNFILFSFFSLKMTIYEKIMLISPS